MTVQDARLLDVVLWGPLLLWFASRPRLSRGERMILAGIGLGTVLYNAGNYLAEARVPGSVAPGMEE